MVNWTDKIIHWNQLGSSQVKRLLDTWGFTPEQIAAYDASGGKVKPKASKAPRSATPKAEKTETKKVAVKKAEVKKVPVKKAVRQKHTGADGEIKFVEHRNLYVGFFGGKVVVTKRTEEACKKVLSTEYGVE